MSKKLPDYSNPPLIEVVCGILFNSIDKLKVPHIGLFWEKIKKDYPLCQEKSPIMSVIEIFEGEQPVFPFSEMLTVVIWFGIMRAGSLILGIGAKSLVRKKLDLNNARSIGLISRVNSALIILALVGFGLSNSFWLTLILFWVIFVLRGVQYPLNTSWMNLKIDDPQVRATIISASSQVDAIGQITGGPVVGVVGNRSIRTALLGSAALLTPVLPLYSKALRTEKSENLQ